jgi:endonuclease/exonuclease/phosphatase (EEP) superfamily protein YafD
MIGLLVVSVILCLRAVLPYTILGKKTVIKVEPEQVQRQLSILTYNVLQTNTKYQKFIDLVKKVNPDIILTLEVDQKWDQAMSVLEADYPHTIKDVRDNTYGISMMSRISFDTAEVKYLVKDDVPSLDIHLTIEGKHIRIIGVHPEPPIPGEALTSMPKDLELLKIALDIRDSTEPDHQILIGDLNDVGWSKNSINFKEISGLNDPREGRGFYPSFPTYLPIRIPIDQVFCSEDLGIIKFKRLKHIGSDHFPLLVVFGLGRNIIDRSYKKIEMP